MVEHFQLLRNVGQFDNVSAGAQLALARLALIYGENGRGKTTLATVLRSLGTGEAALIDERQRLGAAHKPHVIIAGNGTSYLFQNSAWSATLPEITVFDDAFVAANVCSGIEIEASHRQNLHELILGAQGVSLNAALVGHVAKVEVHNKSLRAKGEAIPAAVRGSLSVDEFCALAPNPDIKTAIQEAERQLAAAKAASAVKEQPEFRPLSLPPFDAVAINAVLQRDLPGLQKEAAAHVQAHLARLGKDGATWAAEGMTKIESASESQPHEVCPFCAQDLSTSPLIGHYEAYFSQAYADLRKAITDEGKEVASTHGGDVPAAFERAVRVAVQTQEFWGRFITASPLELDTALIARAWKAAREAALQALRDKLAAPLDPIRLPEEAFNAIAQYEARRQEVAALSAQLQAHNEQIALVKEQAASADVAALTRDLTRLKAVNARHTEPTASLCQAYLNERAGKAATEGLRDQARVALDQYRQTIFPAYEASINNYLGKFNAGFRLASVAPSNTRAGSACEYTVLINNVAVSPTAKAGPSFRNTLSAGDRNTLALAFFFASLDQDPTLAQKIVVIDDPMTSLDEHRSLTTVQEMRRLMQRVRQVIVFSHSKPFLCALWQGTDQTLRSSAMVARDGSGSTLAPWDVNRDCVTEHDRRHALVSAYLATGSAPEPRAVAVALRPMLEAFVRVAYPAAFPPGSLLGPFIGICNQRIGTAGEILSPADIVELRDILDYANKFHHDTNPAYETEAINNQELAHFCDRTLRFARRD